MELWVSILCWPLRGWLIPGHITLLSCDFISLSVKWSS
jgi:hypothetical protein